MDQEKTRRVSALIGLFAANPPLSAVAQRAVTRACEAGQVEEVTQALAHALLQQGLSSGKIPPNAGNKKKVQDVDVACLYVAKAYGDAGGVLLARDWVPSWKLASLMLKLWNEEFSPEIQVSKKLVLGMSEQELADRICVAALNCRAKFLELVEPDEGFRPKEGSKTDLEAYVCYVVAKEDLETVLSSLVKATLEAFDDPNAVNHRLLHGP